MQCNYNWFQQDSRQQKHPRKSSKQYYTNVYPTDKIKEMKFQNSEEISVFLLNNAGEIGYSKWQLFQKEVQDRGDYVRIVYTCRIKHCDAILVYLQKKNHITQNNQRTTDIYPKKYFLAQSKIINKHRHILYLTPHIVEQTNIRQYLHDLPVQQKFQNHVQAVKQKFNLKKCKLKYLRNRIFWRFRNQDHMLQKLSQRRIQFRRKIQKQKTSILLLVSESMKSNYLSFGDNLCFDVTYKLLKKKAGDERHVGVGFFVGQDQNLRIVMFGLSTIGVETSENFQVLFGFFFELMGHIPETIVTDDQKAIGYALQKIKRSNKYQYVHLLDWFHKIETLKRQTKRQPSAMQLNTLFFRLLKQPSKQVYFDICTEIATLLDKKDKMSAFLNGQEQYCLSQASMKFFGFGISSTRAQAFNALVKRSIPHQTNFGRFIYFVLRIQRRLLNRMTVLNYINDQLISYIQDDQILMLSKQLQTLPFEQIRQYYQQSRTFETIIPGKSPIQKIIPFNKYQRSYQMNVKYDIKNNCWRCECANNFRTGMPCSHLIRVIKQFKGSVSYYINERWYHNKQNAMIRKASRPSIKCKKI